MISFIVVIGHYPIPCSGLKLVQKPPWNCNIEEPCIVALLERRKEGGGGGGWRGGRQNKNKTQKA